MAKTLLMNFLKGILAGLAIGLGGFLFILMTFSIEGELGKVLGSLLFATGLFLVCTFMLSLFTGKVGLIFEKKQETSFYVSLPVMLLGNAVGAVGLGYICFAIFKDMDIMQRAIVVSNLRLGLNSFNDYLGCIVKGLLCGLCVYLAVKSFNSNRLKPVGILLLVTFVFLFVYGGFEHCIANMFYFSFSNSWGLNAFLDLIIVIIMNSLGTIPGVLLFKLVDNNGKQSKK